LGSEVQVKLNDDLLLAKGGNGWPLAAEISNKGILERVCCYVRKV